MGKVVKGMGGPLGIGLTALGIASGTGWFTNGFFRALGVAALGSALSPTPKVEGQRLESLGVQLAQEGADLPRGWGSWRQAGVLVYCPGLDEHEETTEAGGKGGGPEQTEYSYSANFMIIGGSGNITRFNRIRFNEHVEYAYNNGNEKGYDLVDMGTHWVNEKGNVRLYPPTYNKPVDSWIEAAKGVGQWTSYPGLWGGFWQNKQLRKYNSQIPNITFDMFNAQTDLAAVTAEICALRGYAPETDLDLYELEGTDIAPREGEGFVLASRGAASSALDQLGFLFNFTLRDHGPVLQAIRRGRVAVAVLGGRDVLARNDNDTTTPLEERLADANELPLVQEVNFSDAGRENNVGYRAARRVDAFDPSPAGARGGRRESMSVTASLYGGRALRAAQIKLHERWAARETFPISVSPRFLRLAAGDVITLQTKDGPKECVLPTITSPFFGASTSLATRQDRLLYNLPTPSDGGDWDSPLPDDPQSPIPFVADVVALSEDDPDMVNQSGVLVAATQISGRYFKGARVILANERQQADDWNNITDFDIKNRSTMGFLRTAWTPAADVRDSATNPIPARMYFGDLHSASDAQMEAGRCNILVFETGLVVQFRTATQTGSGGSGFAGDYQLTGITSGRFGSDYPEAGIEAPRANREARQGLELPAGTKFILLVNEEGADMPARFQSIGAKQIGNRLRFRFRPKGIEDADEHETIEYLEPFRARNMEELSPSGVRATRADGGISLSGRGRTRYISSNSVKSTSQIKVSAKRFNGGFKYLVTLILGSASKTVECFTSDENASFDSFTWTAAQLATLFNVSTSTVTNSTLSGSLQLCGENGFGRKTMFTAAV